MVKQDYEVVAYVQRPDFAAMRRYLCAEADYVRRQLDKPRSRWRFVTYAPLGIFRRVDWEKYEDALEKFGRELNRREKQIADGLLPLEIEVKNRAHRTDSNVRVRLEVHNGAIHEKLKGPQKPKRIDGMPTEHKKQAHWPKLRGFARRSIKIGRHNIAAEFSRLEAGDSALLVNRVVYVQCHDNTRLEATVQSSRCVLRRCVVRIAD